MEKKYHPEKVVINLSFYLGLAVESGPPKETDCFTRSDLLRIVALVTKSIVENYLISKKNETTLKENYFPELFHEQWGEDKDTPFYNKKAWIEVQRVLHINKELYCPPNYSF